ncbi:MAG: DegV family EDD domain-containing protein [Candidatus Heimdallarchaeota archaeon]|nr:DegV family EDD domain-containing protein [Candidatus Heimdallarchaeota archaeon]
MRVKLITDSTACLSKEFYKQEDIGIVESLLRLDDEYKRDISDIDRKDILNRINERGFYTFSVQADPQDIIKIIEDAISDGFEEIFYIGVSKKITDQFEIVKFVSDLYREKIKITLFQSGYMGSSQGGMVLIANKMLKLGKSVDEIIEILVTNKDKIKTMIISESFKSLFKTGKIRKGIIFSPFVKYFGKYLRYKLIAEINEDEGLISIEKARGIRLAISKAIKIISKELSHDFEYDLLFSQAGCDKYYPIIEKKLKKQFNIKEVQFWEASPIVIWAIGAKSIKFALIPHF